MSNRTIEINDRIYDYLLAVSVREPPLLARLREETAQDSAGGMQIAPEQGQFMALLVELLDVRRAIEIGIRTDLYRAPHVQQFHQQRHELPLLRRDLHAARRILGRLFAQPRKQRRLTHGHSQQIIINAVVDFDGAVRHHSPQGDTRLLKYGNMALLPRKGTSTVRWCAVSAKLRALESRALPASARHENAFIVAGAGPQCQGAGDCHSFVVGYKYR